MNDLLLLTKNSWFIVLKLDIIWQIKLIIYYSLGQITFQIIVTQILVDHFLFSLYYSNLKSISTDEIEK